MIVTNQDLGLSVNCHYDLSNRSISNGVSLEVDGCVLLRAGSFARESWSNYLRDGKILMLRFGHMIDRNAIIFLEMEIPLSVGRAVAQIIEQ